MTPSDSETHTKFAAAMRAPLSIQVPDLQNAVGLISNAFDAYRQAHAVDPSTVIARGYLTGLTQKLGAVNSHIALGVHATHPTQEDDLRHAVSTVTANMDAFNHQQLRGVDAPSMR